MMYQVYFYRNSKGEQPVANYLRELAQHHDKNSRIHLNKIRDYVKILQRFGKSAGDPYMKHLDADIWELRPLDDRILFVAWYDNSFILLHHFTKKTQKTPRREIEQAKRELRDLQERGLDDE